jgi:hypothetical protein
MGGKSTRCPTWHLMDNVSWSVRFCKEVRVTQNRVTMRIQSIKIIEVFVTYICCGRIHTDRMIMK